MGGDIVHWGGEGVGLEVRIGIRGMRIEGQSLL